MSFNIKAKAVGDSAFVHLVDVEHGEKIVDEKGQPVGIEIYGKASAQYRRALAELSRKNMQRKGKQQSFETNVEDNNILLAMISKKAVNLDYDGKAVDSQAMFVVLYSDPELYFIKDQVQAALDDDANFTKK